jgi:hypothetical protein
MLHSCSSHVANVSCECFKIRSKFFDVADMCYWVLQTLFFNVADVAFRCCRHVVFGVVLRRREKKLLMLDVARNTGRNMAAILSQHGRNMGDERRKTPDVGCCKQPQSQHFRNTFATRSQHLPGSL